MPENFFLIAIQAPRYGGKSDALKSTCSLRKYSDFKDDY